MSKYPGLDAIIALTVVHSLLLPSTGVSDPVQGAVIGGAAGGLIGGGAGAAVGAVLGGAGGVLEQEKARQEQERWNNYYEHQKRNAAEQSAKASSSERDARNGEVGSLPSGSTLIKETQFSLSELGYDPGHVDGLIDGATSDAIRIYQEDHGLMPTGKPSRDLLVHLRAKRKAKTTIKVSAPRRVIN